MEKLVPDVRKGPANFRWFTTPTSAIEMRFSESAPQPLQICLSETVRQNGWLILKLSRALKRDPILNYYLTQTMGNNARSGVRRVRAEMSFIFIFPSIVRIEKTCVVFWALDQSTDYINRSSKRLCLINWMLCRVALWTQMVEQRINSEV